ncbi:hypothetical protein MOSE0_I03114 [Monosporozyma servazzii]
MPPYKVSTGRGGAGNIHYSNEKISSPKIIPEGSQTPSIISPMYSTGRGGIGNMRKNVDPVITRKAQDVGIVKSKPSKHKTTSKSKNTVQDLDAINEPFIQQLSQSNGTPSDAQLHNTLLIYPSISNTEDPIILKPHDDDNDYITPITNQDLFEENNHNKISHVLTNIRSHISPVVSNEHIKCYPSTQIDKITSIDSTLNHHSKDKDKKKKKKKKKIIPVKKIRRESTNLGLKIPPPIVIGRGGAGNIVSPIITADNNNDNNASNNNNIQHNNNTNHREKKRGFFSSIINIFA